MGSLLLSLAVSAHLALPSDLVAYLPLNGSGFEAVQQRSAEVRGGAISHPNRDGFHFDGQTGVVALADAGEYGVEASFSVAAVVQPDAVPAGNGQIVFRGDDRNATDTFSLSLGPDGYFTFMFDRRNGERAQLMAPARIGESQALLGTYDRETSKMRLWINGEIVAQTWVPSGPVSAMIADYRPGLSVGNVQAPEAGVHRQPFRGWIRDVRVYRTARDWSSLESLPVFWPRCGTARW